MARKYAAEFIGTFGLVFCGTGAIIINEQTHGAVGNMGIAITFGLIILAMVYTFGDTSGAHLNPAVTLSFAAAGCFKSGQVLPYIIFQVAGAFLATAVLKFLFPDNQNLGTTIPAGSAMQSFVLEFILTFLLMLVILHVSVASKEAGNITGLAIGGTVGLEAMFAGPVSGASMNPARSLAPAMVSGNMETLWVYLLAPISGALFAALVWLALGPSLKERDST